jgi:hypothetical protein
MISNRLNSGYFDDLQGSLRNFEGSQTIDQALQLNGGIVKQLSLTKPRDIHTFGGLK